MKRDDEGPKRVPDNDRRRSARSKRTRGVGRTGARFPSAREQDPEADALDQQHYEAVPDPEPGVPPEDDGGAPGSQARAAYSDGRAFTGTLGSDPDPDPDYEAGLDEDGPAEEVGRTGARFGPFSARKAKRHKQSDTENTPAIPEQGMRQLAPRPSLDRPPRDLRPDPKPFETVERTEQVIKPWSGALVRPYAHTGGRTKVHHDLALEALISSHGRTGAGADALTTHHRRMIVDLCLSPRSVAEVAALLAVPLGVARVLLDDLATAGAVMVHPTASATPDGEPDVAIMHRILAGLRRL